LKNSDANVRSNAAFALGRIGAEAKTALPQLVPLLKDSDADVRSNAAEALGRIGAEAMPPRLWGESVQKLKLHCRS
jgi:HEAT repeat protein